jgi:riboflavin kinase/FMN adenylyltransferase
MSHLQVALARPTLLTIGVFDGVHLGHQHLIQQMRQRSEAIACLAGVITLHPHPRQLTGNGQFKLAYLINLEERTQRLKAQGIDWIGQLHFDESIRQLSAAAFITRLYDCLSFTELWAGPDFALGSNREGNLETLSEIGQQTGFRVSVASPLMMAGQTVSSTRIRELLAGGEISGAQALLGTPYRLSGSVVTGFQRGRLLGFPTANIQPEADILVPANGVYAVYFILGERRFPAVVNIGNRPTFDNGERSIEAYILDINANLYGQRLTLEFVRRLRTERQFPNATALVSQIESDIQQARSIL